MIKITKHRSGIKEKSDNLPKITQLKCGSIGKSGNVPKTTQFRSGSTHTKKKKKKWKHREVRQLA